ncbi:hypothetical protein [Streptomyces endophytica]|uniref:Uncharacterized protein n=1 Tax=Streptomyces endophytica TaxID=2991496 RepID=A0ABY6PFX9_9ACTN|nr:hypothetical protein [Streptomyces endophytica]UZJ32784.1 hypothetical protein OJ254_24015 [Streptomyces endophytica]
MRSTAYVRKCRDQEVMSSCHIVVFAPDPWSSSTGGASFGPETRTKVSPSRVGIRTSSAGTGQSWSISR